MTQQFPQQQFKTRLALLLFLKGASAPIVLFFEDILAVYEELLAIIRVQPPVAKLIEKEPIGPIKKIAFMSNQIISVALQEEVYQQ